MEEMKRLKRELVYTGTILKFYKDTIQTPKGNIVHWDFIGHNGASAVVPVLEDGRIAEVGNHNQLCNIKDGIYKKMFEEQRGWYENET